MYTLYTAVHVCVYIRWATCIHAQFTDMYTRTLHNLHTQSNPRQKFVRSAPITIIILVRVRRVIVLITTIICVHRAIQDRSAKGEPQLGQDSSPHSASGPFLASGGLSSGLLHHNRGVVPVRMGLGFRVRERRREGDREGEERKRQRKRKKN